MHDVLARWFAALMLALLIATLDRRDHGGDMLYIIFVRTVLLSILLDALRRAF